MSEENKKEEVNNENENKTEELKQEEKVEEVKEEKVEEVKEEKVEEVKEEKAEEKKKEEKPSETKQEEKKEHVRLVETKTPVKEKKFPWKVTGIVVGAIVLSLSSGALGGYVGGKVISNQMKKEVEDLFQPSGDSFSFNGNGGSIGGFSDFGGFEVPEEDTDTPALGITVQKTDESNLVIAGFADGSNGEKNGLEVGDVITKVDGKEVSNTSDIAKILDDFKVGDSIKVTVTRDGKEVEATITLVQKTNTFSFKVSPSNKGNSFPEDDNEKVKG